MLSATAAALRKASSARCAYLCVICGLLCVKSFCKVYKSTFPLLAKCDANVCRNPCNGLKSFGVTAHVCARKKGG